MAIGMISSMHVICYDLRWSKIELQQVQDYIGSGWKWDLGKN